MCTPLVRNLVSSWGCYCDFLLQDLGDSLTQQQEAFIFVASYISIKLAHSESVVILQKYWLPNVLECQRFRGQIPCPRWLSLMLSSGTWHLFLVLVSADPNFVFMFCWLWTVSVLRACWDVLTRWIVCCDFWVKVVTHSIGSLWAFVA